MCLQISPNCAQICANGKRGTEKYQFYIDYISILYQFHGESKAISRNTSTFRFSVADRNTGALPKMKRQPRKRLIRDRSHPLIKAAGLSAAALAERAGYSLRQTLYALDGRRTCPERVADVLCATLGPDGWRFLCGEADSVTLTRTFKAGAERAAA